MCVCVCVCVCVFYRSVFQVPNMFDPVDAKYALASAMAFVDAARGVVDGVRGVVI